MSDFFCWYLFGSLVSSILNSPIVIAILSLSFGGWTASLLASRYQRRQQIFELRVQSLKNFLDIHADWLHTHLTVQERETHQNFMRLLTANRYLKVLFPSQDVADKLKLYHDAAAELTQQYGQKIDVQTMEAEDKTIAKLQYALNDVTKVLVSKLGIPEKG
jgi:hypothetical protein